MAQAIRFQKKSGRFEWLEDLIAGLGMVMLVYIIWILLYAMV